MRICMWSGPRNLSTAMMRSFGARADMAVMDEPFFAPFLAATGAPHPGREETLERHETDPHVVARLCAEEPEAGHVFQKHMPHHMVTEFPLDWAKGAQHFFLIRDPVRVMASYIKGRQSFTLDDLGYAPQRRLYDMLSDLTGQAIPVLDAMDILEAPARSLSALCMAIDLSWDEAMLSWQAGPRDTDGAWAPYWYKSVENSTGFAPPPSSRPTIPDEYVSMLEACIPDYTALKALTLT